MFASFLRIIKFSFQDLGRNVWLTFVTLTLLVLALVSVNLLLIFNVLANNAIDLVENKIDISLYFKPGIEESQVLNVKEYIENFNEVAGVDYISRDIALNQFEEKHRNNQKIIESLKEIGDNPLGAALVIRANNSQDYPKILERLGGPEYTNLIEEQDFDDHKTVIARITNITDKVSKAGIIIALIFTLISILIIYNAIRVAIYTHREEIRAMKLVGSTNWYIQAPFILEGIIYAVIACVVTISLFYPFLGFIQPYISVFYEGSNFDIVNYFNNNFYQIFGYQLLGAVVLNIICSGIAVRKYLDI